MHPPDHYAVKAEALLAQVDDMNLTDEQERTEAAVLAQMASAYATLANAAERPASTPYEDVPWRP